VSYTQYAEPYPASRGDRYGATAGRATSHRGQDTAPGGLPALALARGKIVKKHFSNALGNIVTLEHPDGKFTSYTHLDSQSVYLVGTPVALGASVGAFIGKTGTAQNGRHLHYTLGDDLNGVISGHVQDPLEWIAAHSGPETRPAALAGRAHTATESDGIPGPVYWSMIQSELAVRGWYSGPVDGVPGTATHHGHARLQAAILNENRGDLARTSTEEDGAAGPVFWTLAQTQGRGYGYGGPVDGVPGDNTERALFKLTAAWLNRHGR